MAEKISGNSVQMASNNVTRSAPEDREDAKEFKNYMADVPPNSAPPKPEKNANNGMVQGATSLAGYMQQLKDISENQQF